MGGTFQTMNKTIPDAYINFVSATRTTTNISDRGVVALPMILDWGIDKEVFEVSQEDLQKNSLAIFGYDYTNENLRPIREVFLNAVKVYFYKLNNDGEKATGGLATAKHSGIRGNDLKYVVSANVDEPTKFDVKSYLGTTLIDEQLGISTASELVDNDYIVWNKEGTLEVITQNLTNGTNGTTITGSQYQSALDKFEAYDFNILVCNSVEETIKSLFVAYTKRMRDQEGVKFQTVMFRNEKTDYEGIISVENEVDTTDKNELIYWVAGAEAGCPVNASCTNKVYNGEYLINTDYKKAELEVAIKEGKFIFYKKKEDVKVLTDINTFVSFTENKNNDFAKNQVIRVLDQIANDTALLFNSKYLGNIPNDADGRTSMWADLVAYNKTLENLRAIQNFNPDELVINEVAGNKDSVEVNEAVQPTVAMEKLYMTVIVK